MQLDLIGKRLGNYQIEQALGRGGMALVYKALDTTLKRPAAIKVIAPDLTDQERYQDRFEHEAQSIAAARLGAATVDAVEVEPVAAAVCQENVERNDVQATVRVLEGTLEARPEAAGPYNAQVLVARTLDISSSSSSLRP